MKTQKWSLRKIVSFLNNKEEDGGFWLPNIQRPFVWSEEQICRLFDSILRQYPISTLLIWKTKAEVLHRKFIDHYKEKYNQSLSDFMVPADKAKKCLVLDGQQRLQSLYIGLCGTYEGKQLFFDILSGMVIAPDDMRFKFDFLEPSLANFPYVSFKEIVFSQEKPRQIAEKIAALSPNLLGEEQLDRIKDNVDLVREIFHNDSGISYQELDSIEEPNLYHTDDVVEIFIRANSGGTRLGKSDLLFSLLASDWDSATKNMEELLDNLNRRGYRFTQDFILKTCLTLLNQRAAYKVDKFRKNDVRTQIQDNWDAISKSIEDVVDFLYGKTLIRCDKALPSYLALIPLIYLRYHYREKWDCAKSVEQYLVRALLAGSFGSHADLLIDQTVDKINEVKQFDCQEMFDVIQAGGRSLAITEDKFWGMGYDSSAIHLLFNLWYPDFDYNPAFVNNLPQIDHVFPKSALMKIKKLNPRTGRHDLMRYLVDERNQLANCMLLKASENGSGGKSDTLPNDWFEGKGDDYLDRHLIPKDKSLWHIEKFDDFITERKKLIKEKFSYLLLRPATHDVAE